MDSAEVTEIKRHIDGATEGFRADVADVKRHIGVVAESLRSEIRQVAEGVAAVDSRLSTFQTEVAREFEETRAMVRLSYRELDRRIRTLETGHADLESRVERLEAR
jgi:predicted RNase H-like nuclease (RuvC/YqgF family)